MEQKLQQLLERIRAEGVEKARKEADEHLSEAREKAERILSEAREKATEIKEQARKEADEHRQNVAAELKLSVQQSVDALQQRITELVTTKALEQPVEEAFQDEDFIKKLIDQLVEKWSPEEDGLTLDLADSYGEKLLDYFAQQSKQTMQNGLTVKPTPAMREGFRLGPKDGRYVLSFQSGDFKQFFAEYLRSHTRAMLFEQESE